MSSNCCKSRNTISPDYVATKSTIVKTPDGEELQANINAGTGEITYESITTCCKTDPEKAKNCGCKK